MSTSIATISPAISLQIAPNPAVDYLQIQADFKITAFTILSLTGQSIQQFSVSPTNSININLPDLPQGLYVLKAKDNKGNYALQKWVKKS